MTKQKAYVQFSKRIVLLVTIAVTAISLLAVVLCFFRSDTDALISTVRTYINYATIVFAAYSGNSVFEKWLTQGKSNDTPGDTEEKEGNSEFHKRAAHQLLSCLKTRMHTLQKCDRIIPSKDTERLPRTARWAFFVPFDRKNVRERSAQKRKETYE